MRVIDAGELPAGVRIVLASRMPGAAAAAARRRAYARRAKRSRRCRSMKRKAGATRRWARRARPIIKSPVIITHKMRKRKWLAEAARSIFEPSLGGQ